MLILLQTALKKFVLHWLGIDHVLQYEIWEDFVQFLIRAMNFEINVENQIREKVKPFMVQDFRNNLF